MADPRALVTRLWPGREARLSALAGGITNANFLVDLGDERVVLRLAGEGTALLGIDRDDEAAANEVAASIGIAPPVLARSADEGWLVTRYLPARPPSAEELASEPMLGEVASTLRALHGAGPVNARFEVATVVRRYHEVASARGVDEPFDFDGASAVLERVSAARPFRASAFCHNDLLASNILYDDRVRILDWEYAGMGDPFFDLANYSVNQDLSAASDESLLTGYFGRADERHLATLDLFKILSELREAMWGVVQRAVSALDVDFAAYARERGRHFEALVAAADLNALAGLAARLAD